MYAETELWIADDPASLRQVADALTRSRAVGVDTEGDSLHHYREKVCLIQFSDLERDYLVDPLAVPDLSPLAPMFADRSVVKIFHGADYDVVSLKRDFGFSIHNIFDTMIASQMLGTPKIGLADLVDDAFGVRMDKKYQRHDWASRPLEPEHIEYARGDTHYLLALRELLVRRLERSGRTRRVEEECRLLERREWEGRTFDPDGWLRVKGARALDMTAMKVLRRVWLYRDEQARLSDRPPFKVLPDHVLLDVARARPTSGSALDALFAGKSMMKRRFGSGILQATVAGLDDPEPNLQPQPSSRPSKTSGPARLVGPKVDEATEALKLWRNARANRDGVPPIGVASNGVLRNIARARPTSLEELSEVEDVRGWQVEALGAEVLQVLDKVAPAENLGPAHEDTGGSKRKRRPRRRRPAASASA